MALKTDQNPLVAGSPRRLQCYLFTIVIVLLTTVLALVPAIGTSPGTSILVSFFAITLCAWIGGFGPGIFATGLIVFITWPVSQPFWELRHLRLFLFVLGGILVSAMIHSLHKSRREASECAQSLQAILDASADLIFMTDSNGRYIHVSGSAASLFNQSCAEMTGRTWHDLGLKDEFKAPFESLCELALRSGKPARGKLISHTASKGIRSFDCIFTPIFDETASAENKLVVVARDITDQERADDTNARLAAIVESSDDAIVGKNLDGIVTSWNRGAERLFGYRPEEMIGQSIERLIPLDRRAEEPKILEKLRRGERVEHFESVRITKGGRAVDVYLTISPIRDSFGQITGASKIVHDITERKRAEEALRTSEERLAMATQAAGIGTWDVDVVSEVCDWSPSQAELFGFPPHVLRLTYQDALERVHPEDVELLANAVMQAQDARGLYRLEFRVILPNGSIRWLASFGRFQYDHSGTAIRLVGVSQEITDRKRAEEATRASERKFVQMLESITDGFVAFDHDWRYSYLNPQARNILGRDPSELLGRSVWEAYPGTVGSAFEQYFQQAVTERVAVNFESYYPAPLNKWFSVHAYPSPDGLSVLFADVTERRRADEAVRVYASRLESLRAIDLDILSAQSSKEIANAALQRLAQIAPCWTGAAALYFAELEEFEVVSSVGAEPVGDGRGHRVSLGTAGEIERHALLQGQTVVVDEVSVASSETTLAQTLMAPGLQSFVLAPLWDREETIGLLCLGSDAPSAYCDGSLNVIQEVADHLAIAIRQSLLRDEILNAKDRLETISRHLIRAEEVERRRIARELHDETGQGLVALKINLNTILRNPTAQTTEHRLNECLVIVDRTIAQVRSLSVHLRPTLLDDFGLIISLKTYCEGLAQRLGIVVEFFADPALGRLEAEVETACYRIVQEALNNVTKYAKASEVRVQLEKSESFLIVLIADNGLGFDVAAARARATGGSSFGVLGMEERATLVGGSLTIESEAGHGTIVRGMLPFRQV